MQQFYSEKLIANRVDGLQLFQTSWEYSIRYLGKEIERFSLDIKLSTVKQYFQSLKIKPVEPEPQIDAQLVFKEDGTKYYYYPSEDEIAQFEAMEADYENTRAYNIAAELGFWGNW